MRLVLADLQRLGQVAHRRVAVGGQPVVAALNARQGLETEPVGQEAQDRGGVVEGVIDEPFLAKGETMMAGMRVPGPQRSAFGGATWSQMPPFSS